MYFNDATDDDDDDNHHGFFEPNISDFEPPPKNETTKRHGIRSRMGRRKRHIAANTNKKIPQILFIETAIFVDKDLFRHMAVNYPKNTEGNLIRFVLAMINGVNIQFLLFLDFRSGNFFKSKLYLCNFF